MQGTYNLSLFNYDFKNFIEKRLISNGWKSDAYDNAIFSDYTKNSKIKYGFVNTHNLNNIRKIFGKNKNKVNYILFTKKNMIEVEPFLNKISNVNHKFFLRCNNKRYNHIQYICKNYNQIKSILKLRFGNVQNNIFFLLERIEPTISYNNNNNFTINTPFLLVKNNNNYEAYIYPEWYINVRDKNKEEKEEQKEEDNKVDNSYKVEKSDKVDNIRKLESKINKDDLQTKEHLSQDEKKKENKKENIFLSKEGNVLKNEKIINNLVTSLQINLDIFKDYLKISNKVYDLEKNKEYFNTSDENDDVQICLFNFKCTVNENLNIIPLYIQNIYISNPSKKNVKDKITYKCLEDCIENFIVPSEENFKRTKFIPLKLISYNFVDLKKNIKIPSSNSTYFLDNINLEKIDLSISASLLVEKILIENIDKNMNEHIIREIIEEFDYIKKYNENPLEIKIKKIREIDNKNILYKKDTNIRKKMAGAVLLAGTTMLLLGQKKFNKSNEDNNSNEINSNTIYNDVIDNDIKEYIPKKKKNKKGKKNFNKLQ